MKRRKVIAKVVHPGQCRYYRTGQTFVLGGFTPKGLCDSAYAVLARDARVLAYGGTLPWQEKDTVRTHCPDPKGAVWELRTMSDLPLADQPWQVVRCRAVEGDCPNALTALSDLAGAVEAVIRESDWSRRTEKAATGRPVPPHLRLRVALAACPNACTQPQVQDIGLIASVRPVRVSPQCTGCGQCATTCREGAIAIADGAPKLDLSRCVGCGACGRTCLQDAMEMSALRFRILVGGRLGRHPSWAMERPGTVEPGQVISVLAWLLMSARERAIEGESFGMTIRRLGPTLWNNAREP